jgi:enamine deaminase RidA (YjgF/YER057c/UK114 family)
MKMDISVGRKDHINVGDFSSVEPNLYITVKDVDSENAHLVYDNLSVLLSTLHTREAMTAISEMENIVDLKSVIDQWVKVLEEIDLDEEVYNAFNRVREAYSGNINLGE